MPTRSRLRLTAVLGVPVILVGLTAASGGRGAASAVELGSVGQGNLAQVVDVPGTVTARAVATLVAPDDGMLRELRVRPGESVHAGQVLAVIDSPAARERLRQARRALDAASRTRTGVGDGGDPTRARRGMDRAAARAFDAARAAAREIADPELRAALLAQIRAARRQYDAAARAATDSARATRHGITALNATVRSLAAAERLRARQEYDRAKATVDALTLRAPTGGVVQFGGPVPAGLTALLSPATATGGEGAGATGPIFGPGGGLSTGDRVNAGAPVLTVVDAADPGLVVRVDQRDVALVRPGLAASAELDAVPGVAYPAVVRAVDVLPAATAAAGVSYRVRLSLGAGRSPEPAGAPQARPGMTAVVHLTVREVAHAVSVPATAILRTRGRDAVWVVRDGRATLTRITAGVRAEDLVQIIDGVRPGERVVIRGASVVRAGQQLG